MNKDHDVKIDNRNLEHINAIDNESSGAAGSPHDVSIEEIKFRRIEQGVPDEKDIDANIQLQKLSNIQATENEVTEYLNIPLSGKWMPAVNPIHIGHNFRTLTNMRYTAEHPVSIMGMTKINTTTFTNIPINMFHYTKAAVVNSAGAEIRSAESHLIVQSYVTASGLFTLKQNEGTVPHSTPVDFSATTLYPSSGTKIYTMPSSFSTCPNDGMVFCYGEEDCIWDGDESRVPAFIKTDDAAVAIPPTSPADYTDRINNSLRTTNELITLVVGKVYLIGSTRPLSGINAYISNTVADCFETFKYYKGGSWGSLTAAYTGGTYKAGYTFTAPTDGVMAYIEGYFLYWYSVTAKAAKDVYHVTLSSPMVSIENIWDGSFLEIANCLFVEKFNDEDDKVINDITLNVLNIDDYLKDDLGSFFEVEEYTGTGNDMDSTDCIYAGFTDDVCALYFDIPEKDGSNTKTASIAVSYWNGTTWTEATILDDGTAITDGGSPASDITLAHTGVVSFEAFSSVKLSINGGNALNYVRITGSADIAADTKINYIAGIRKAKEISGHSFAIHAADRLMLGCDNYGNKNELLVSAQDRPEVFNGSDSQRIQFGDNQALTGGVPIFAQYASNIYNIILVFKATQTWILQWNQSNTGTSWSRYCISPNVGCPAPNTICSASVAFDNNVSQVKNVAIWRGNNGIYISNGQSPYCVSQDISHVFDRNNLLNSSLKVNQSMISKEFGFVDEDKSEYHWLWASGSSTTLDKEYVLDLKEWKWFEIDRDTVPLQSGTTVSDTSGNKYCYGGVTGFVDRLEYGVTFHTAGHSIISALMFGELIPSKNPLITSSIKSSLLTCFPKQADSSNMTDVTVTLYHYRDGGTGTSYSIIMDESLSIDVSPATDWEAGDVITGQTSGKTCIIVSKISAVAYKVKERDGVFTPGEIIGVTGNSDKLADQGAAYPQFKISTNDFVMMKTDIGSQDASFHGIGFSHTSTASTKGFEPLTLSLEVQKGREK